MNIGELKKQIKNLPDDMKVRTMNALIETDESCPTFDVCSASVEKTKIEDVLVVEFKDDIYIQDDVCIKPANVNG
jgi:hypothetical protein